MAKPKVTMPDDLKSKCAAVIHTATTAAAAAGVIPIPMADTIPITGAQMTMIMGLAKVFDIPMTQAAAQSILGGTMASQAGRATSLRESPVSEPLWAVSSALVLLLH